MTVNYYTYTEGLGGAAESEYTQPNQSNETPDETKSFEEEMNDAIKSNTNKRNIEINTTIVDDTTETKESKESDLWKLFEDIKSLMKTGFTEDELEYLEKLKKAIYDEYSKKDPDEFKLEDLIASLEKAIAEFKKRVTGEAIIKAEDNPVRHSSSSLTTSNNPTISSSSSSGKLTETQIHRIKEALTSFENFLSGKDLKENVVNNENITLKHISNDELELLNRIKNFQQ